MDKNYLNIKYSLNNSYQRPVLNLTPINARYCTTNIKKNVNKNKIAALGPGGLFISSYLTFH